MRFYLSIFFLLASLLAIPAYSNTAIPSATEAYSPAAQHSMPGSLTQDDLLNLKPREIAARTGQKMNFFQRLAFRMIQKKLKKQKAREQRTHTNESTFAGKTSYWLGVFSLAALPLALALALLAPNVALFLIIASPILGILAFIFGKIAKGKGDQSQAAKTGLSIGTLFAVLFGIALGLFLLLGLLVLLSGGLDLGSVPFPLPGG